jgi:uncharacterized C2H2 Zn-finger protein
MRQLIDAGTQTDVTCDKPGCGYIVTHTKGANPDEELLHYVNKPCPNCGEVLCTPKDYMNHVRIGKVVKFINRWFGWITIFYGKNSGYKTYSVHSHNEGTVSVKKED